VKKFLAWFLTSIIGGVAAGSIAVVATVPSAHPPKQISISISGAPDTDNFAALPRYDSLHEAAVAAAVKLYECSHYYECSTVIAKDKAGKFLIRPFLLSNDAGDNTEMSHGVPAGFELAADEHSHPCLPDSHEVSFFSPQDIMENTSTKTIGYMLDQCTGEVHEFIPGVTSPNETEMPGNPGVFSTHGKIVGKIPVDGKSVEPHTGA
jgi:hypothetical protein